MMWRRAGADSQPEVAPAIPDLLDRAASGRPPGRRARSVILPSIAWSWNWDDAD
jgi:hypothetical protein